jgi:hypothetical protein
MRSFLQGFRVVHGFNISGVGSDFFEAFCGIRDQLATHGFYPLCYGASLNVFPSPMSRDMSAEMVAYKMQPGRPVEVKDLVDIFETGPDLQISTVAAQKPFWSKWLHGGS